MFNGSSFQQNFQQELCLGKKKEEEEKETDKEQATLKAGAFYEAGETT